MTKAEVRNHLLAPFNRQKGSKFIASLLLATQSYQAQEAERKSQTSPEEYTPDYTLAKELVEKVIRTYYDVDEDHNLTSIGMPISEAVDLISDDLFQDHGEEKPIDFYMEKIGDQDKVSDYLNKGIPIHANFFIRKINYLADKVLLEVSPVSAGQEYKEQLVLEIPQDGSEKSSRLLSKIQPRTGDIVYLNVKEQLDGTYALDDVLSEQPKELSFKIKKLGWKEASEHKTNMYPTLGYGALNNMPLVEMVPTESDDKDFTYTFDLQTRCDTLAQYRMASVQIKAIHNLQESERFQRFINSANIECVGRSINSGRKSAIEKFMLNRHHIDETHYHEYLDSLAKGDMSFQISADKKAEYDAARINIEQLRLKYSEFHSEYPDPNNLDELLEGHELQSAGNELVDNRVMHNIERPFEPSRNTEIGSKEFFSQLRNYTYQKKLREEIVSHSHGLNNIMQETEKYLLAHNYLPMANPYRDHIQTKALNKENSEMISMTVLAALMRERKAIPRSGLERLFTEEVDPANPGKPPRPGKIDEMFKALEFQPEPSMELTEILEGMYRGTEEAKSNIEGTILEVLEKDCYPPGKAPHIKRAKNLDDLDNKIKSGMVGGGLAASGASAVISEVENLSIFR